MLDGRLAAYLVSAVPAAATVPNSVAFWNGSDGLVGTGRGCCAGTISVTSNSGNTSNRTDVFATTATP